jgi:hypothetical protein
MRVARLESVSDGLRAAQDCLGATMPAGSPERVLVAARRAAAFADELRSVAAELTAAVDTPIWRGVAHAAFLDHVHVRLPAFGDTAARYDGYAAVLSGYAAELRTAMDELPWLRRELVLRVQALGERAVAPSGRPDAVAEVEHRQLLPYARRFVQVHSRWADAVDRCSAGLSLVDRRDPSRDRHGWRLVAHRLDNVARYLDPVGYLVAHPSLKTLSQTASLLSTELTVVGLALLFVCPPAGAAALGAATAMSAVQLLADAARKADGSDQVGWTTLGLDVMGAVPVGGRVARLGADAAAAGERLAPALARTVSHLAPGGGLAAHEAAGGHTLARHVGKSDQYLLHRLNSSVEPVGAASTFLTRAHAESSVGATLSAQSSEVARWLAAGSSSAEKRSSMVLRATFPEPIGRLVTRSSEGILAVNSVRVVLLREPSHPLGYYVRTAYATR